jgi:indole-3-glycerol phosphate synthase
MKDILLTRAQVDAAAAIGADAILLIHALFERGYGDCNVKDMIDYAHAKGLEVLLEAHTEAEFALALDTEADLIGINNRDLRTFTVDLSTTPRILQSIPSTRKVIVSESGIKTPIDIRFLHASGAQAFLVGSAIMDVDDIEEKVRELVMAL